MTPTSGTITGAGAAVRLSTALANGPLIPKGKWVEMSAPNDNSNVVRLGGAEVTSTVGFRIFPGAQQFYPPVAELTDFYDLSTIYVYVAVGDTLDVLYGG